MIAEINKHMLKFSILSHSIISYNPFTTTIVAVAATAAAAAAAVATSLAAIVGRYKFYDFFTIKSISLTVP